MAQATVVFRNNAIELMRSQRMLARQAAMLEEQLAQEQRLALLQRNFVSMASHEFRTPLTVIDGHARRLIKMKDTRAPAEIGERGGKIRGAVLRHDASDREPAQFVAPDRRRRRALFPSRRDGRGGACCRRFASCTAKWCRRRRSSSGSPAAPMPMVRRSRSCCFRFSAICLSNAIKYSPGGGAIEVDAAIDRGEVVVVIADRGIGIPAGDLGRLFERYHRGSNVSGIVGTGVGLYLVKMAVDLHGGRVEVDSREGRGSCFTVRLPVKPALPSAPWPAERTEPETDAPRSPIGAWFPGGIVGGRRRLRE